MKRVKKKLTAMLNAMTFAEAGEHGAAREFLEQDVSPTDVLESSDSASPDQASAIDGRFTQLVKGHLIAAAFAEAGEFETARSLSGAAKEPRAVLLVSSDTKIGLAAFSHAVNLCKRLKARLEIVAFVPDLDGESDGKSSLDRRRAHEQIAVWAQEAEDRGVPCLVDIFPGTPNAELWDAFRAHKGVAAVVDAASSTSEAYGQELRIRTFLERVAKRLSVPLVKVARKKVVAQPGV